MYLRVALYLMILCSLLMSACAGHVHVTRTKPAVFPVQAGSSLAVVPVRSGYRGKRRTVLQTARHVTRELRQRDFYAQVHVLDDTDVRVASQALLAKEAARIGADAAVAIALDRYEVDTTLRTEWIERRERTGRRVRERYMDKGVEKHRMVHEYEMRPFEEVHVEKRAHVRMDVDYVRVGAAGDYRSQSFSDSRAVAAQGHDAIYDLPEDYELLRRVSRGLVRDVANALTPYTVTERRRLSKMRACKAGNKLARKREWAAALASWRDAASGDAAAKACAAYNSGIVYEAQERFAEAAESYARALAVQPSGQHEQAVQRMTAILEEQKRLAEQRKE